MPFVNNQGIKIYYEIEGQGPPLVLVHGLFFRGQFWRTLGYTDSLKKDYQLILVDVRGHGQSDKPDDYDAYDPKILASDIVSIMDDLNIQKAHYFGYSMGAWIGYYGIVKYYLSRFNSLILGGFSFYPSKQRETIIPQYIAAGQEAATRGMEAYLEFVERFYGLKLSPSQQSYMLTLNPRGLLNINKQSLEASPEANPEQVLAKVNIPCLIYAGEADSGFAGIKKTAENIPNAKFFSLLGLNHITGATRSDVVLPHIMKFLVGVETS